MWLYYFTFPQTNVNGTLTLYPDCNIDNLFNLSNSNGYMVESHYSFNLNFSDDWWWWNLSAYWLFIYIFWKYLFILLPNFMGLFVLFWGERVLLTKFYVFFFLLIIKVFKKQKLLIWKKFDVFTFLLWFMAFISKTYLPTLKLQSFSLILYIRHFIVLALIF